MSWFLNQHLILELIFLPLILQILLKQRKIKEKVQVYQVFKIDFYHNTIIFFLNDKYTCLCMIKKNDAKRVTELCIIQQFLVLRK